MLSIVEVGVGGDTRANTDILRKFHLGFGIRPQS